MSLPRPRLSLLALATLVAAGCGGEGNASPAPVEPAAPQTRPADPAPPADPTPATPAADVDPDEVWAALLGELVTDTGLVRYDMLADDDRAARLEQVVSGYAAADLPEEKAGRIALWSNAYNANVMLDAFRASRKRAFESVLKEEGFFDARLVSVAGEQITLNDLENKRIRPLGDPRIHAILVCAAMSCPPLRNEPYAAARLDEQLNDQCKRWINDRTKFRIEGGKLGMSEILKWYSADFDVPRYGNAVGFVLAYADPAGDLARYIVGADKPQVTWLTYDWSLNTAR
jgi:hypothetical protein